MNDERENAGSCRRTHDEQGPFVIQGTQPHDLPSYEALASFGIGYDDSMAQIRIAEQKGQVKKDAKGNSLWNKEVRGQFTSLTKAPLRLILDLFHVHTDSRVFETLESSASDDTGLEQE